GAERHSTDESGVAVESADQFSGPAVPDLDLAVLTPGGDPPALLVGAERHRVDLLAVPAEGFQQLGARLDIPDLDRVLLTARRQSPAVRAEGHVHARPGDSRLERMAGFLLLVQAPGIPKLHLSIAACRGQVPGIATEDHGADFPVVDSERV